MQDLKEQIKFQEGYLTALRDIQQYLIKKTNYGVDDQISALDVLENCIVPKLDLSNAELQRINLLIPNKN